MYAHVYHLSFFSALSSFFKIIFLRGNWFKIEQWQRESTWRFACSQETQEPTGEYISRTVKIGCISFMKILLCIAGGAQWIYLVHLPHRSDLLYYCTSCLRLIFRQTCIFRENENACADRKFEGNGWIYAISFKLLWKEKIGCNYSNYYIWSKISCGWI